MKKVRKLLSVLLAVLLLASVGTGTLAATLSAEFS